MILTDYHMHTSFSVDSDAPMENMVKQAIVKGFKEIAFTDHVDFQSDCTPYPYQIDYNEYIVQFVRLKEKYANQINLLLGVEMGLAPRLVEQFETLAKAFPFDFIIGSSHEIEKKDIYTERATLFRNRTKQEAYEVYFNEILENAKCFSCFCVYGHLDYIVRYGTYEDNSLHHKDFFEIIDSILKALIETGKGLELNMSGFRYGLNQTHPQLSILKRYKQLGGEIITIGSDAHSPQYIGDHFDHASEILQNAGFKAYTRFKERKPFWEDLK